MSQPFAKGTAVSVAKSRAEIEQLLHRYGATKFGSGWGPASAVIMCEAKGRQLRFDLPLPDVNDKIFAKVTRRSYTVSATPAQREAARDAEHRRRWRALALVIKAKLEAVASGISTFEDEFLANMVVPGGKTFGEWARPQLVEAYEKGIAMPSLLGSGQ